MNGQRYQKKEEESVVPSADAVVHLVPNMKREKNGKREKPDKLFDWSNKQTKTHRHLLKQINRRAKELIACSKSI